MAMVTDYDCWRETDEAVTVEMIIGNLQKNARIAQDIIGFAVNAINPVSDCACHHALANAILTRPDAMRPATRRKLDLLIGKYLPKRGNH
jgi:5'-methylthioadenosine phosphorylase